MSNMTSTTHYIIVYHRRRILGTTSGHIWQWNDISLILYYAFGTDMKQRKRFGDITFILMGKRVEEFVSMSYKGRQTIVDDGYLSQPTTIPLMKLPTTYAEMWLEMTRKDVECTFVIMKGRSRVLKTGIPLHGMEACDQVWKTFCALHNILLDEGDLEEG